MDYLKYCGKMLCLQYLLLMLIGETGGAIPLLRLNIIMEILFRLRKVNKTMLNINSRQKIGLKDIY